MNYSHIQVIYDICLAHSQPLPYKICKSVIENLNIMIEPWEWMATSTIQCMDYNSSEYHLKVLVPNRSSMFWKKISKYKHNLLLRNCSIKKHNYSQSITADHLTKHCQECTSVAFGPLVTRFQHNDRWQTRWHLTPFPSILTLL